MAGADLQANRVGYSVGMFVSYNGSTAPAATHCVATARWRVAAGSLQAVHLEVFS